MICATVLAISVYFSFFSHLSVAVALSAQFLTAKVSQVIPTNFFGYIFSLKKFSSFFKCVGNSTPILWLLLLSFLKRSFIGDFEDSNLPFISNNLEGQVNLRNAINKSISFYNEKKDKTYALDKETDILLVRSRGLHLNL
jgi:hypothetical protein